MKYFTAILELKNKMMITVTIIMMMLIKYILKKLFCVTTLLFVIIISLWADVAPLPSRGRHSNTAVTRRFQESDTTQIPHKPCMFVKCLTSYLHLDMKSNVIPKAQTLNFVVSMDVYTNIWTCRQERYTRFV